MAASDADWSARSLAEVDPAVARLIAAEADRRASTIDLIASESEPSPPVLAALGSVFAAKTGEGYPGRRYHRGTRHADEVEQLAIDRAKALFGADHANVQPSSGVNANLAVYRAILKPGDTVLALRLDHGGHLSHGDRASITGAVYRFEHYGVRRDTETIDLDEVRDLARRHRPRLIVTGGSSYPRAIDYAAFGEIAREVDARLLVDMAHVAGLVAAGALPSPVPHADVVTFTTYKTMLGPHGGVILARSELAKGIDRAIFPGTQGAPDFGRIAAKAVCFGIAATPAFRATQAAIVANAQVLADGLASAGDRIVSGGTDNHMVLVDLRGRGLTGDVAEVALEEAGILANRNVIPFEEGTPDRPSGLRLGTTAVSQRGMREAEMREIAGLIDETLRAGAGAGGVSALEDVRARAERLAVAGLSAVSRQGFAGGAQAGRVGLVSTPPTGASASARAPLADRALAERVRTVPPSGIRKFFDILATMDDVISLGIGEPDFDTPRSIIEAGVESLREGRTHYTSNYGTLELRKALAEHLQRLYGVEYDPKRELLITVGASEAVDLALRATCDPGDEVILHEPSYVAYEPAIAFAGGTVVHVSTRFEDDFALDPAAVEAAITPRTKALFLGYPCNPTGAVLPDAVQDELARIAERHDLLVYSDEIYDRLAYGSYRHRAFSALPGMRERTILMGGFSKAYAMTGWRIGWMAAPADLIEGILKIHQYTIMTAPTVAQDAALVAIVEGEPEVERMLAEYDRRRRLVVDGLNRMGLETFEPRGAFYAFPRITSTGLDAETFSRRLLEEEHVAVVPGGAFGPSGENHVRACYATSYERLEEALSRIDRFVQRCRTH